MVGKYVYSPGCGRCCLRPVAVVHKTAVRRLNKDTLASVWSISFHDIGVPSIGINPSSSIMWTTGVFSAPVETLIQGTGSPGGVSTDYTQFSSIVADVSASSSDDVYLARTSLQTFGGTVLNMGVTKYDSSGNLVWETDDGGLSVGTSQNVSTATAKQVETLSGGDILVRSRFFSQGMATRYTSDGTPVWSASQGSVNGVPNLFLNEFDNSFLTFFSDGAFGAGTSGTVAKYDLTTGLAVYIIPPAISGQPGDYGPIVSLAVDKNNGNFYIWNTSRVFLFDSVGTELASFATTFFPNNVYRRDFDKAIVDSDGNIVVVGGGMVKKFSSTDWSELASFEHSPTISGNFNANGLNQVHQMASGDYIVNGAPSTFT